VVNSLIAFARERPVNRNCFECYLAFLDFWQYHNRVKAIEEEDERLSEP
jgi:hypothetical protein